MLVLHDLQFLTNMRATVLKMNSVTDILPALCLDFKGSFSFLFLNFRATYFAESLSIIVYDSSSSARVM